MRGVDMSQKGALLKSQALAGRAGGHVSHIACPEVVLAARQLSQVCAARVTAPDKTLGEQRRAMQLASARIARVPDTQGPEHAGFAHAVAKRHVRTQGKGIA